MNVKTTNYAALACVNYRGGQYGDWYLPSKFEMNYVFQYVAQHGYAQFGNKYYWTSSEIDINNAWVQNLGSGGVTTQAKSNTYIYVRAIRRF